MNGVLGNLWRRRRSWRRGRTEQEEMDGARGGWRRIKQRWNSMWRKSRGSMPALRAGLGFQVRFLEIILDLDPDLMLQTH